MQRNKWSGNTMIRGISATPSIGKSFLTGKSRYFLQTLLLTAVALGAGSLARAASDRTWVSGVGDDTAPCSRTAPCKTFAGAISKTNTGGEVDCIDTGSYGTVTISKSMTIDGGYNFASILAPSGSAITIDDAGDNSAIVRLRNLSLQGSGTGVTGIQAISFKKLEVENCRIAQFKGGVGRGISVTNSGGDSLLMVQDTIISNCDGSGIYLGPANTAGVSATAALYNVTLESNLNGLKLATGQTIATVEHSNLNFNTNNGVVLDSGNPAVHLRHNQISHNGAGITVTIGQANIDDCYISNNSVSMSGNVHSWSSNLIVSNFTNTLPTEDLMKH